MRMMPRQGQQLALAQPWDQENYLSYLRASNSHFAQTQAAAEVDILKKSLQDQNAVIKTLERVVASMEQTNKSLQEKQNEALQRIADMADAYDAQTAPQKSEAESGSWWQNALSAVGNFFKDAFGGSAKVFAEKSIDAMFKSKKSKRKRSRR